MVMRWVDDELSVHEEFIGLYIVPSITSSMLFSVIDDILARMNLSFSKIRGQCYDGASNMSGSRSGVAKLVQDKEPRALYTHCYGHSLNLAASDMLQKIKILKSAMETTHEITKLIKYSPRRENLFKNIKGEIAPDSPGVRVLCPTRWTVKADSMKSIIQNYEVLMEVWDKACEIIKDTQTIARIRGIASQMITFDFFYGLVLGETLLRHTDNLSRTLQHSHLSASEGQAVAAMTITTLMSLRNEDSFDLFWKKINTMAEERDVDEPTLPRNRKRPSRYEESQAPPHVFSCVETFYRQIYFEALDLIIQSIKQRFDQPGYRVYQCLESLILKAARKEDFSDELKSVTEVYGSDLDENNLQIQLQTFSANIKENPKDIFEIRSYLNSLTETELVLLSEVVKVMKLILVMPATNASSERTFSAMRRVKSYLRSTMTQERLNHLMILHVHKELTDKLDLISVANEFVQNSENRQRTFGTFK